MQSELIQFPEVIGKSIAEVSIHDDDLFGREVLLRFTDGTQLSIAIGVRQVVDARYCHEETPDSPIFVKQDPNIQG